MKTRNYDPDPRYSGHFNDADPNEPFPALLIGSKQIAKWLRVCSGTAARLCAEGILPGYKSQGVWHIPTQLLVAWCLAQHRKQAAATLIGPNRQRKGRVGVKKLKIASVAPAEGAETEPEGA